MPSGRGRLAVRVWIWTILFMGAFWLTPLSTHVVYPGVAEVLHTPELRTAVGYAILLAWIVTAVPGSVAALVIHRRMRRSDRRDLAGPAAFIAAGTGSAVLAGLATCAVATRPFSAFGSELAALAGSLVLIALVVAGAGALFLRRVMAGGSVWPPLLLAALAACTWAHLMRGLLSAIAPADAAYSPWLIAVGASLAAGGSALDGKRGRLLVGAGLLATLYASRPFTHRPPADEHHVRVPVAAAPAGRPNVLILMIDTWRYDATSLASAESASTPALAGLVAQNSTLFSAATAAAPSTIPSVKALVTGRPASHFGIETWGSESPPPDAWSLARALRSSGYRTAAFLANNLEGGFESGYDQYWLAGGCPNVRRSFFLHVVLARTDHWRTLSLCDQLRMKTRGDSLVAAFSNWLERRAGTPFFAYVHLLEPHWPYEDRGYGSIPAALQSLPAPFSALELMRLNWSLSGPGRRPQADDPRVQEMVARYREEVRDADRLLAKILGTLSERRLLDDTLLVIVGDHGEEFFEHGGFGHGYDVFEEQVHVPLVIRWPQGERSGSFPSIVSQPVSLLDIAPTLADFLELPEPPQVFRGRSLRPALQGPQVPFPVISEAIEGHRLRLSYRLGSWKARFSFASGEQPSQATDVLLFDLDADPAERHPLPPDHPGALELVERARTELDAWWSEARSASAAERTERAPARDEALKRLRALGYVR